MDAGGPAGSTFATLAGTGTERPAPSVICRSARLHVGRSEWQSHQPATGDGRAPSEKATDACQFDMTGASTVKPCAVNWSFALLDCRNFRKSSAAALLEAAMSAAG